MKVLFRSVLILVFSGFSYFSQLSRAGAQVVFGDPDLETVVRQTLQKPTGIIEPADMVQIVYLGAEYSNITNLVGLEWASNLVRLDLTGNSVSDLAPLQNLHSLTTVWLDYNQLVNVLPLTNASVVELHLLGNPITNFDNLVGFSNLHNLDLEGCSLLSIPSLQACPELQVLSLYRNKLTDLSPLSSVPDLLSLDVGANIKLSSLASAPPMPLLTNVSLQSCGVTNAAGIEKWPALQGIDLSFNLLSDCSSLAGCTNLRSLNLIRNWLGTPASITNLPALTSLSLDNNQLTNLSSIESLSNLRIFSARDDELKSVSGLETLPNLSSLTLDRNPISDTLGLRPLLGLTNLSLNSCTLTNLGDIQPLAHLQSLHLDGNNFSNVDSLTGLTNLVYLSLAANRQCDFTALGQLPQLTSLYLDACGISNISFFTNLTKLRTVGLDENRLTDISPLNSIVHPWVVWLTGNLLDVSPGSPSLLVITNMINRGYFAYVSYLPQDQPPTIYNLRTNIALQMNVAGSFNFGVYDDIATPDQISVSAQAADSSLISTAYVQFAYQNVPPGAPRILGMTNYPVWTLVLNPATNQIGATTVNLTATDDVGISTNVLIHVVVASPASIDGSSFGPTNWNWQTDGHAPWFASGASNGISAAVQSPVLAPTDDSWLQTTVTGPGLLAFRWRMATTNGDYVSGWPRLNFSTSLGGNVTRSFWSDQETNWLREKFSIPAGDCTVRWDYIAGASNSCLIDQICYEPTPVISWVEISNYPWLTGVQLLTLHAEPGGLYEIQSSADMVNWLAGRQVLVGDSFRGYSLDSNVVNTLFYRLRKVPAN